MQTQIEPLDKAILKHCDTADYTGVMVFAYRGWTIVRDALEMGGLYTVIDLERQDDVGITEYRYKSLTIACIVIDGAESILEMLVSHYADEQVVLAADAA